MAGNILALILSVTISSVAHLALKLGAPGAAAKVSAGEFLQALNPWVIAGIGGHGLAMAVWLYALSRVQLSFAYPFLALGYVFVALLSYYVLGEQISLARIAGMAIIIIGLCIVALN